MNNFWTNFSICLTVYAYYFIFSLKEKREVADEKNVQFTTSTNNLSNILYRIDNNNLF